MRRLLARLLWPEIRRLIAEEGLPALKVGASTVKINPDSIDLAQLTADPSLAAGRVWFRSDEGKLYYSPDGSTVKEVGAAVLVPLVWDDTRVSAGTSETEVKNFRFAYGDPVAFETVYVRVSLWVDTSGATGYAKVYLDSESSARLTLSTTSTSEALVSGSFSVSGLAAGIHTMRLKIYASSGNVYSELWEVWAQ